MDEIDPVTLFRQEAAELMEQLELALLDLDSDPQNTALVATAFRAPPHSQRIRSHVRLRPSGRLHPRLRNGI